MSRIILVQSPGIEGVAAPFLVKDLQSRFVSVYCRLGEYVVPDRLRHGFQLRTGPQVPVRKVLLAQLDAKVPEPLRYPGDGQSVEELVDQGCGDEAVAGKASGDEATGGRGGDDGAFPDAFGVMGLAAIGTVALVPCLLDDVQAVAHDVDVLMHVGAADVDKACAAALARVGKHEFLALPGI